MGDVVVIINHIINNQKETLGVRAWRPQPAPDVAIETQSRTVILLSLR